VRRAWSAVPAPALPRHAHACRKDTKILELAATTMECDVEAALEILLEQGRPFDFREVQSLVEALRPQPHRLEELQPLTPCLNAYDDLLEGIRHAPNDYEPQPIAAVR
jgi:hypothetical protein